MLIILPVQTVWSQTQPADEADAAALAAVEPAAEGAKREKQRAVTEAFKQGLDAYLKSDFARARKIWRPLADQGDPVAAFNLGVLYARGQGGTADPARAVHWYRKAADAGYTLAQFNLGAAYMTGQGVEEDHNRAAQWWARAAQNGHPQALFNLGTLYLHGDGVPRDTGRGINLIQKAADLGDARAYRRLQLLKDPTTPPPAAVEADAYRAAGKSVAVDAATPTATPPLKVATATQAASTPAPTASITPRADKTVVSKPRMRAKPSVPQAQAKRGWVKKQATQGNPPTAVVAQAAPAQATPARAVRKKDSAAQRDTKFLAGLDPQQWTIQVSAFKTRGQAQQFIARHKIENDAILITAKVKGRTWHKVMYGVFENAKQAQWAIGRMGTQLRKRSPWARRVGVVHKELVLAGATAAEPTAGDKTQPTTKQVANTKTVASGKQKRPAAVPPARVSAKEQKPERTWRSKAPAVKAKPVNKPDEVAAAATEPDRLAAAPQSPGAPPPAIVARAAGSASDQQQLQSGQSAFNNQDYATALRIWAPLAAKGMDEAQYGLGFMYESGWGVKKDYGRAYQWYRRAAEQGHAKSQFNLGLLYQAGLGVPKNEALANYWIQSAADHDDPRAKQFLGNLRKRDGR